MSPLAISIRFLQTQPDQRLLELARAGHERAFEALKKRGTPAIPFLREALNSRDLEVARRAERCLAEIDRGPGSELTLAVLRLLSRKPI